MSIFYFSANLVIMSPNIIYANANTGGYYVIHHSSLFLTEYFEQYSFKFNKRTIRVLAIKTALSVQLYGLFFMIFYFEIY